MQNNNSGRKRLLVTGTAGFIGFHLIRSLFGSNYEIVGLDNINDYYDVDLKFSRLAETGIDREKITYNKLISSTVSDRYKFIRLDLEDKDNLIGLFKEFKFDRVVNLAAQAGVRYGFTNPDAYVGSNITGFLNILEACRHHPVEHLVFASSSSVYGLNKAMPFSVHSPVDHPASLYAASKKSNELLAHSYSHLFRIPVTGLRFFTVYGPWGRPDMSLFIFVKAILEGKPFNVHNEGRMERDFTYVADIVSGVEKVLESPARAADGIGREIDPAVSSAPYRLYNIGNSKPVRLMDFISTIEEYLGRKAIMNMIPIQPGEVEKTWADVSDLESQFNYAPDTPVREGVKHFIDWYRSYFKV
ncbi:MAG: capsule biosynthesis protein CapI [Bacteroides sp. SM1_62]|nr:MAG: capsule biosynthesis protein CapI [Bacteroides sp. SM1_62]